MKRSWDIRSALALLTVAALPLQAAMAARGDPADSDAISEVVVTATHREENEKDVPVSISVVDSALLSSLS